MNTRRFPRTSVEAFGCRGDAACPLERPSRDHRVANWTMGFALVYLIALAVWEWLA
jgi:hypothetical protein